MAASDRGAPVETRKMEGNKMSISIAFWVLMLIWLVLGLATNWPGRGFFGPYGGVVNSLLLFVLFALLGWHDFGAPIHG